MTNETALLDSDRSFRRILTVSLAFYLFLVIAIQLKGESLPIALSSSRTQEPPRLARLLTEPKRIPPPKIEPPKVEPAKLEPPKMELPKVERPAPPPPVKTAPPTEKAQKASPGATAKALPAAPSPEEGVKKAGLLGLLGGSKGPGSPAGRGFSSLKEMPPPSGERKIASAAPSAPLPSFAQEEIEKIRQRTLAEQEKKITQTRRAVVQEDLSQTKITQEGGGRNQQLLSDVVHQNRGKLLALYNRQLQKQPDLQGFLTVEFVISPQGRVVQCRIVTSSVSDPAFEESVIREILRWTFPSVDQGTTTVLYPLSFSPTG